MDTQSNQLRVEFTKADLRRLIVPLVIEQLLSITVGLSDSLMVSQVGEAAISAVSLVDTVNVRWSTPLPRWLPEAPSSRGSIWAGGKWARPVTPPSSCCCLWRRSPWR